MRYKKLDLEIRYKNLGVFERFGYREMVRLEKRYKKLDLKMSYKQLDLKMRYKNIGVFEHLGYREKVRLEMRYKKLDLKMRYTKHRCF